MSYLKVETDRQQVNSVRHRVSRIEGMPDTYMQKAWLYKPCSKHPIELEFTLPEGVKFYEDGVYMIDPSLNIVGDKYGALSFRPFSSTRFIPVSPEFVKSFDETMSKITSSLKL